MFIGQLAILFGDGPYDPVQLCETWGDVDAYNSDRSAVCSIKVRYGSHVRIIAIGQLDEAICNEISADVEIESIQGGWSGWVDSAWTVPVIPIGTTLTLDPIGGGADEAPLFLKLAPDASPTVNLPHHTQAKVLSQVGRLCKIKVLSGVARGAIGFTEQRSSISATGGLRSTLVEGRTRLPTSGEIFMV